MRLVEGTHGAVLRALERANRRHRRPCAAAEVIAELLPEDVRLLRDSYLKRVRQTVSRMLREHLSRGEIWTTRRGSVHQPHFYASPSVLDPRGGGSPEAAPRRRRVLALVEEAVVHYRRPIRAVDISTYIGERGYADLFTGKQIIHDLLSLKQTGELQVITIRGDSKGFNTYLPAELDAREYVPGKPPTWMEEVRAAFDSIWQGRLREAEAECRKPRPVSTSEVRALLTSADDPHPYLKGIKILANAMLFLSLTERPVIRRVRRDGSNLSLWAPLDVPDESLDISNTYVTDYERLSVAVRRACEVHARPVMVEEVAKEIMMDETLRPAGNSRLAKLLTHAAKEMYGGNDGVRLPRARRAVRRVGTVGKKTYYWHEADGEQAAEAFVSVLKLKDDWRRLRAEERVNALDGYSLPTVAVGQALLLVAEAEAVACSTERLVGSALLDESAQLNAEGLLDAVTEVIDRARVWLSLHRHVADDLPSTVAHDVPGWTAAELRVLIEPLSLTVRRLEKMGRVIALMRERILRVPNPSFTKRFAVDHVAASLYLFDRTDALLFTARQWGNEEALFQAGVATAEVGRLRDARFVLPGLKDPDFERRLTAVACMAFLPATTETRNALRHAAEVDPDPSVRATASWAYRLVTSPLNQLADLLTE